jgi:hypothetical protein
MLDDNEWRRVSALFHKGTEGNSKERMYASALREYERITGFHETNPNVLWDHVSVKVRPPMRKVRKTSKNTESQVVRVVYAPPQHE